MSLIRRFLAAESGAVTVDWLVLSAAITGLGLASATAVRSGAGSLGTEVSDSLTSASVVSLDCLGTGSGPAGFECYTGPTIASALGGYGFATGGGCWMDSWGNGHCGTPTVTMVESFLMSDGRTFTRTNVSSNGTTVTTWADADGNPVETPPPV